MADVEPFIDSYPFGQPLAVTTGLLRIIEAPDQATELLVIGFKAEAVLVQQNCYVLPPGRTRRRERRTLSLIRSFGVGGWKESGYQADPHVVDERHMASWQ